MKYLFIILLFVGCNTPKHIAKMQAKYCKGDTVTVIDTEFVEIHKDTTFVVKNTDGIKEPIIVNFKDGTVTIKPIVSRTDIKFDVSVDEVDKIVKTKEIIKIPVISFEKTKWDKFCRKYFLGRTGIDVFLLFLLSLYFIYKKKD